MKITWGHKIAVVYLMFVAGILFLVFKANKESFDLVTNNYYEEELKFQDVIDQKQRASALSALPEVAYEAGEISIQFPQEFANKEVKGVVYLYRPSDAKKDIHQAFTVTGTKLKLALPTINPGLYDIKLSWQADGKTYFHELKKFF
ncbi:FixH family protein [Chitinophagaceae bacterium LB-8]|uniref:FixH family protein n=1 Tax=Paraflavisolibacter caeni TaxID=2982496 RepID=A0A9X3BK02_9BACT|nr:FixH family protein [Paraflavisolibacter caeni]MCU7551933.1 FixH family protein [Paraflavisolibacter caeni]